MYCGHVVERHFAGLQSHIRCLAFLHLTGNLQGNKIVRRNRHAVMGDNAAAMRTADHTHAAIIGRAVTERQPCRGIVQFAQAHIKAVLMPGNISGIVRALPEYAAGMDENIGTKNIFNSVEHFGMENQVLGPTMKWLKVTQPRNLGMTSEHRCQFFQGCPRRCYFRSRQDRDGKDQAILLVFAYLLVRKQFRHGQRFALIELQPVPGSGKRILFPNSWTGRCHPGIESKRLPPGRLCSHRPAAKRS